MKVVGSVLIHEQKSISFRLSRFKFLMFALGFGLFEFWQTAIK